MWFGQDALAWLCPHLDSLVTVACYSHRNLWQVSTLSIVSLPTLCILSFMPVLPVVAHLLFLKDTMCFCTSVLSYLCPHHLRCPAPILLPGQTYPSRRTSNVMPTEAWTGLEAMAPWGLAGPQGERGRDWLSGSCPVPSFKLTLSPRVRCE